MYNQQNIRFFMKLIRIVTYTFNPIQDKWKSTKFDDGVVVVNTFPTTKDKKENPNTLMAIAEIKLKENPNINSDNSIEIPEIPRKLLERRIEDTANIISVSEQCKRQISSTHPYIAFKPESDEERKWLEDTNGIHYDLGTLPGFGFSMQEEFLNNNFLNDRLDGVTIMSEAISCTHLTGKLHELMRLFERAFTLSSSSLIGPLSKFLSTSKIKIDHSDVKNWILDLRHPATHADKKKTFVLESDVRPHIYLIEQAAFDVLFNKMHWRDTSIERRDAYIPKAGVGNDGVGFVVKDTAGLTIKGQMMDQFSAYPFNLDGGLTTIPDDLWFKKFEKE